MQYPNWFGHYAQGFFERHLSALVGRPRLCFVQIGAFTGDASLWLFDHVLTGPTPLLLDVDTWAGSDEAEHEPFDFADVEKVYDERTADLALSGRLVKYKMTSLEFFHYMPQTSSCDFIYIDGDHTAAGVLSDAVHAYPLLKVGGLIAFDDYQWKSGKGRLHDPGPAIDAFADLYSDRFETVETGLQVWLRKVA